MYDFLLFSVTLIMTIWLLFSMAFSYTEHMSTRANVLLTSGAIIAAPVAWYYLVVPVLLFCISN